MTEGWGEGWDAWGEDSGHRGPGDVPEASGTPASRGGEPPFATPMHAEDSKEQLKQELHAATQKADAALAEAREAKEAAKVAEEAKVEALGQVRVCEASHRSVVAALVASDASVDFEHQGSHALGASGEGCSNLNSNAAEHLLSKVESLQKDVEAAQAERDSAKSALAMAEMLSQKHEAAAFALQKDLEASQAQLAEQSIRGPEEIGQAEGQLAELQKILEACRAERDTAQEEAQKHEAHACELQKELEATKAELTEARTTHTAQLEEANNQLLEVKKDLEASQQQRDEARAALSESEALVARHVASAEALQKELEASGTAAEESESEVCSQLPNVYRAKSNMNNPCNCKGVTDACLGWRSLLKMQ
jgi:hypothetical protein